MFSAYLALAALPLTLVHGLTISNPTETVTSTGPITITWQTSSGDPSVFSIELINQSFNNQYAIANNVDSSLGSLSLTLPQIPAQCVSLSFPCLFPTLTTSQRWVHYRACEYLQYQQYLRSDGYVLRIGACQLVCLGVVDGVRQSKR